MKRKSSIECNIRKIDILIASVLVLGIGCVVYSFFYLLIDVFIVLAIDDWDKELILTGSQRVYFNVFFAGIGVLLGQVFALQYLMSRLEIKNIQKFRIVNDSWFSIWTSLIFIMQCVAILMHYDSFFYLDSFKDFFPLLVGLALGLPIILFMVSWYNLRRYLIGVEFSKLLVGIVVFIGVSCSIGQIELLDRHIFEDSILQNSIVYKYQINYPKSEYSKTIKRQSFVVDFVIGKNPETNEIELFYEGLLTPLDQLDALILDIEDSYREEDIRWLKVGLRVDKNILIKELLPMFEVFYLNNMHRFTIYVDNHADNHVFNYRLDPDIFYDYLKSESRKLGIPKPNRPKIRPLPFLSGYLKTEGGKDIYCYKDSAIVDGKPFTIDEFLNIFKSEMNTNPKKMIHSLFIDIDITFGEYIRLKSMLYQVYESLRNKCALQQYNTPFKLLSKKQNKDVRKAYPINIKEYGLNSLDTLKMKTFFKEKSFNSSYFNCMSY